MAALAMIALASMFSAAHAAELDLTPAHDRIWGGEEINVTVTMKGGEAAEGAKVEWALVYDKAPIAKGVSEVRDGKAGIKEAVPEVRVRVQADLRAVLLADRTRTEGSCVIELFPKDTLNPLKGEFGGKPVGVIDPDGKLKDVMARAPLQFVPLASPTEMRRFDGLVALLAPDTRLSLPPGAAVGGLSPMEDALLARVSAGMTLLCLDQQEMPVKLPLLKGTLGKLEAPVLRSLDSAHVALHSMKPGDLKAWSGLLRPGYTIPWPLGGNYKVILDVPGQEPAAVMLEMRVGKGRILMCQLPVIGNLASEPLAELMLADMLRLALSRPARLELGFLDFFDKDKSLYVLIQAMGVGNNPDRGAIMVCPDPSWFLAQGQLAEFMLEVGGGQFWCGLKDRNLPKLNALFRIRWEPDTRAEVPELETRAAGDKLDVKAEAPNHPLAAAGLAAGIRPEDVEAISKWEHSDKDEVNPLVAVHDQEHFVSLFGGLVMKFERDYVRIIFWQIPLEAVKDRKAYVRVLNALLTNAGVALEPPADRSESFDAKETER